MASDYVIEPLRIVLLLNENGTKALQELLTATLLKTFLEKHSTEIKNKLVASDRSTLYPCDSKKPSLEMVQEQSLQLIIKCMKKKVAADENIDSLKQVIKNHLNTLLIENIQKTPNLFKRIHVLRNKEGPDITDLKIKDLDITALCCILFELFNFKNIPNHLPAEDDIEEQQDILRIRYYRNLVAHNNLEKETVTSVAWLDINDAIVRLGGKHLRQENEDLKTRILDENLKAKYKDVLARWQSEVREFGKEFINFESKIDARFEQQAQTMEEMMKKQQTNWTEEIKETIEKHQEETEKKLESLMEKYIRQLQDSVKNTREMDDTTGQILSNIFDDMSG